MIFFVNIDLNKLNTKGKKFKWKRPTCKCGSSPHGHGFVSRFFISYKNCLVMKRWRCPKCKTVITARPLNYWKYYQESITNIYASLKFRVENYKWPPWVTRQRGGHWLNKLLVHAKLHNLLKESIIETINFYQNKDLMFS